MSWKQLKWVVAGALLPGRAAGAEPPGGPVQVAMQAPKPPDEPGDPDPPRPAEAADPGRPPGRPPQPHYERAGCGAPGGPRNHVGFQFTGSRVFNQGAAAGYGGRVEIDIYSARRRSAGEVIGGTVGLEGWGSRDGGGGGLPITLYTGFASPHLFGVLGAGLEALQIDQVKGNVGVGLIAPLGSVQVGVWLKHVRLSFDARAAYRWHFFDDSRYQLSAGLALGLYP